MTLLISLPTTLLTSLLITLLVTPPTTLLMTLLMTLPITPLTTLPQFYYYYRLPLFELPKLQTSLPYKEILEERLLTQLSSIQIKLNTLTNKITLILSLRSSKTTISELVSLSRPILLLFYLYSAALPLNTTLPTLKISTLRIYIGLKLYFKSDEYKHDILLK